MAVDALTPCFARSSAAIVLSMGNAQLLVFNEEWFWWAVPSQLEEMLENKHIISCFLKWFQHVNGWHISGTWGSIATNCTIVIMILRCGNPDTHRPACIIMVVKRCLIGARPSATMILTLTVTMMPYKSFHENYRKTSCISRTKYQNLNVSHLILQLSLPDPLKPGVKSSMKM